MIDIESIKQKVLNGLSISLQEAKDLSLVSNKEDLYKAAGEIRDHFSGRQFDMCSIINAKSGLCSEDCKWCSQSSFYHTKVESYELVDEQKAVQQACLNANQGVQKYSLVTSGKALSEANLNQLLSIYRQIKVKAKIGLCASMGLLDKEALKKLKDAGVEHYHCNLETSRSYFPALCSTHTYNQKIQTIRWAQELGMKVCSGGIIGMDETMNDRIELAFELNKLGIDSIPVNILNPVAGTPLEGTSPLSDEEVLTSFALFRFINPKAKIRFAGGRMQIKHLQQKALAAGVNAALVGDLLTTIGSNIEEDKQAFIRAGFDIN
ncbi:biotin synthase BioB [Carboxylicivirga linearis]|uniref:Biotin synthase n=1 Tax=Carboxylicivirga linearis TaxID=1628157 RepID=A0ABS5K027_9BACT|nr:biotin synthase BioB [Carboxylicivirga linearis]MBS2100517.1 biotin synthase BioB [Carboxylicivirga linearis]